jgi:hypothetical protein
MLSAQRYGLAKRGHELFAMRAVTQMPSDLQTDVIRELVIDKRR